MNINSMQFISHRDSIASSFAEQTSKSSSMLSSRRRLIEDEQNDLQDFKQEIEFKFIRSVANKTYTYPLNEEGFDIFDDQQQFSDLIGVQQYFLYDQTKVANPDRFKKQQFKIKNPKLTSKNANLLLQAIRTEKQRIMNLRAFINQPGESKTRAENKNSSLFNNDIIDHSNAQKQTMVDQSHNYRKKRLNTEPYEKPVGFVIKKGDKYVK